MRSRHQDGWVEERGHKVKRWYGHYYVYVKDEDGREVRQHRGIMLGEKAKLRKWEAENKLREEIKKATKGVPVGEGCTLAWFTQEKFVPMKAKSWAPSTRDPLIFPSESGTPMRPENWMRRRLKPDHGSNPKDVAAHLRHSNVGTTLNHYTQSIPANVRKLVNAVAEDVTAGEKLLTERIQ